MRSDNRRLDAIAASTAQAASASAGIIGSGPPGWLAHYPRDLTATAGSVRRPRLARSVAPASTTWRAAHGDPGWEGPAQVDRVPLAGECNSLWGTLLNGAAAYSWPSAKMAKSAWPLRPCWSQVGSERFTRRGHVCHGRRRPRGDSDFARCEAMTLIACMHPKNGRARLADCLISSAGSREPWRQIWIAGCLPVENVLGTIIYIIEQ